MMKKLTVKKVEKVDDEWPDDEKVDDEEVDDKKVDDDDIGEKKVDDEKVDDKKVDDERVDDEEVDVEDCTWTDVVCIGLILRSAVSHCSSPSSSITFVLWKRWWLR